MKVFTSSLAGAGAVAACVALWLASAGAASAAPGTVDVAIRAGGQGFGCTATVSNLGTATAANVVGVPTSLFAPVSPYFVGTLAPGEVRVVSFGDCGVYPIPTTIALLTSSWDTNWANNRATIS
ncbi:hypothetical protein SIM91_04730 [Rhodococcus opacus]|uniref:hypothetical protein n=1 Tax=Rhodococcus opacus TaxID=37919 RepID=UPI00224BB67F|nr:hypothetical protein [Rhodococcus opacus]MDX5962627.1 hypothetical protein [Rhodococcus opacus]CAG7635885.1 hypothetical protein E143388_07730 [Rhodococcus opacus]